MPRIARSRESVRIETGEDVWPAFERAERALDVETRDWPGRVMKVLVTDTGGVDEVDSIAEARAAIEGTRHQLSGLLLSARTADFNHKASVVVFDLEKGPHTPKWIAASAESTEDSRAVGLVKVLIEEVRVARAGIARPLAPDPPASAPEMAVVSPTEDASPKSPVATPEQESPPRPAAWRRALNHPWVVGIGVTVIGTIIATAVLALVVKLT